jgi:hypothetical protein
MITAICYYFSRRGNSPNFLKASSKSGDSESWEFQKLILPRHAFAQNYLLRIYRTQSMPPISSWG